ncbi:MAG: M28 family peptidase [Fimbriimonas sp.]
MRFAGPSLALFSLGLIASVHAQVPKGATAITSDRLKAHLEFIADDLLEGRNTPSRGLDIAAAYIAANLKLWGVQPAGDNGTYFQRIVLRRPGVTSASLSIGGKPLALDKGFYAWQVAGKGEGRLVFAGYGWKIPSLKVDPYANLDVKGKLIVVQAGGKTEREIIGGPNGRGAQSPFSVAKKLGAAGVIVLPNKAVSDSFVAAAAEVKVVPTRDNPAADGRNSRVPTFILSKEGASSLFEGESTSWSALSSKIETGVEASPFAFSPSKTASFEVATTGELVETQNVVGYVEGTDPVLKNEYVAIGAHYDHVGTRPSGDDRVYNGADDDGSGTVATLEIAHAFGVGPKPKRSILFVWHAGEERGLWGSDYFVTNPTVPLTSIITQLNIDMIGRSRSLADTDPRNRNLSLPNGIYLIGSRMMSDDLGNISEAVNRKVHRMEFDYKYDDPNDPERFFYRSDHYNYARVGIPIIFYFNGVHEDYHGLDDEVEKIDFDRMERIAQTIYSTALELATRPQRPKVLRKIN